MKGGNATANSVGVMDEVNMDYRLEQSTVSKLNFLNLVAFLQLWEGACGCLGNYCYSSVEV